MAISRTAALRIAAAVTALALCGAAVLHLLGERGERAPPPEGEATLWFGDLTPGLDLAPADEQAVARLVSAGLDGKAPPRLSGALAEDRAPRIVFLTVASPDETGRVVMGVGTGLRDALERAVARARGLPGIESPSRRVKIDLVDGVTRVPKHAWRDPLTVERGIHGVAFDRGTGVALLPGEVLARVLLNRGLVLERERIEGYLEGRSPTLVDRFREALRRPRVDLFLFTTRSLFLEDGRGVRLFRGHRTFRAPDRAFLLEAARRGGRYLTRAVDETGRFAYSYLPKTDELRDSYNILRHAGTAYSMLELHEISPDGELLEAARRAIRHLVEAARPTVIEDEELSVIVERGFVKLGGNALACVALSKYTEVTGDRTHLPLVRRLGRWMLRVQREDGRFAVHKQSFPEGNVDGFRSGYYPGEAVLALLRIHGIDGDERWLDAAERAARYLIEDRDGGLETKELSHDHWLLYALDELYRKRPGGLYLSHARRIVTAIVTQQNLAPEQPDWRGSYYRPPRSTPTATRTEGLCAAYRLERDHGDEEWARRIRSAIRAGIGFQLRTQFGPESTFYLADPRRASGGFRKSLTDYEIRIDYVQHNISALLGAYRILE